MDFAQRIERALASDRIVRQEWSDEETSRTTSDWKYIEDRYDEYRLRMGFSHAKERAILDWLYMVVGDRAYQKEILFIKST